MTKPKHTSFLNACCFTKVLSVSSKINKRHYISMLLKIFLGAPIFNNCLSFLSPNFCSIMVKDSWRGVMKSNECKPF